MNTIDYALRVATQLQSENKLEKAEIILNSILEINSTHADALHLSGIVVYQTGKASSGMQLIQQAIENNPTVALFHSNLGEMYRQLNMIDLSIQCGQRAIALDPNSATALSNLGIAYYDAKNYEQAEDCHQRALALNPTLSCSLNNMGSIYKTCGKMQQAISFYQAAIRVSPHFVDPYNNLTTLLIQQQEFNQAVDCMKQAITSNPQHLQFYQLLAEIYHQQGNSLQALMYLDQALSINSTLASLSISKGSILMEMGEIIKAEEQFSKITEDPNIDTRILAHYSLVQLRKIKPDHPSLQTLLSIENNIQQVSANKLEYLYFALGKCHDDIGESSKAFASFTQGCQVKRQRSTYNITEQIQFTQKIIDCFTPKTIEYLRTFANPSPLPIFIVGMPRSGSTLVEQILASHPDVYGGGELSYLNDLINQFSKAPYPENILQLLPADFHAITNKYLFYLRHISSEAMHITDKMPQNFIALSMIHALFPNAKIIHIKRNPIDTCLSCYTKLFSDGHYYSYDLTELGQYYNCYQRIMNHWRAILPANAWLDIDYETIIQNLEPEAKRLITYCGLIWDPACLAFYESKRQVRTASFMQVRQPVYTSSIQRWRRFENELEPLIKILKESVPA